MTYRKPPAAPGLELGAHDDSYTTDRDHTAAMLSAETDAMRAESAALGLPDTVEGLLAFAMREVAALRIALRETRAELTALLAEAAALRAECEAFAAAAGTDCETLGSEVAQLKLRVRKLEVEL